MCSEGVGLLEPVETGIDQIPEIKIILCNAVYFFQHLPQVFKENMTCVKRWDQ